MVNTSPASGTLPPSPAILLLLFLPSQWKT